MTRKRGLRRIAAISLMALGGVLMYLSPNDVAGLVLLASGIALELAGIALERKT